MKRLAPNPEHWRGEPGGDIDKIAQFLNSFTFTSDEYWASYTDWSRGEALEGNYWARKSALGGTYTMGAIQWYQHRHKPRSRTYRPSVILDALCRAVGIGQASE